MRTALRQKGIPQGQTAAPYPRHAPIKGWVDNENIADMDEDAAYLMDNFFPETDSIRVRRGSDTYATLPTTDPVETVMVYNAGGTEAIFGAQAGNIYDATAGGAIAVAALSGQTSDQYISLNFATSGGTFHMAANGSDHPVNYDGATWQATPAITGVTGGAATLNYVWGFKARLFFLQNGSATAWYLPSDSIGGAAAALNIAPELTLGGTLVAGGTLTIDSGLGPNDFCVFISSEGEAVIYAGDDPGDPTVWSLRGVFRISRPIGSRCLLRIGGDLAVLCADGVISLTKALQLDVAALQKAALSQNIRTAFARQYKVTGAMFGWQIVSWPTAHMGIVNVPTAELSTANQYVINVLTGAWARYTGMGGTGNNAVCFALAGTKVYFGSASGGIVEFETGNNDNGDTINAATIPAFSAMRAPGVLKTVKDAQIFCKGTGNYILGINAAVDFEPDTALVASESIGAAVTGPLWDSALWDVATWPASDASTVHMVWLGIGAVGYYVAPVFLLQTGDSTGNDNDFQLLTANLLHERGAVQG